MEMSGEYLISASREAVWQALNDVDVLYKCIPGCEEIEQISETELKAKVKVKIGPVKAKFSGDVVLGDLNPPQSYTISGKGSGGVAGFAKGGAEVHLEETAEGTRLSYGAKASVGGKLAQLGQRLIKSSSEKLAGQFFDNFAAHFALDQPES